MEQTGFTSQTKEIGGYEFTVSQLPGSIGLKMFFDLVKMVGPSIGALIDEGGGSLTMSDLGKLAGDKKIAQAGLSGAIKELALNMNDAQVDKMIKQLRECTQVKGHGPLNKVHDAIFAGKIKAQLEWLAFALQVQFSDFLE